MQFMSESKDEKRKQAENEKAIPREPTEVLGARERKGTD
jgi:hypothetical protein